MSDQPWHEDVVMPALLRHARTAYGGAMRRALAAEGYDDIPGNGLYVIGGLAMGDDVQLGALIASMRISKQSAGQLVDALVTRGYLERATDPDDRRRLIIRLTARGREAAAVQAHAREQVDADLIAAVGANNVRAARRTLAALIEMVREEREDAAPGT